jgi:LPS export ABC transporter protein LptC
VQFFKKSLYFGLACLLLGCKSQEQQSIAPPNFEGPDQEGWNSRVTVTSNGRTAAIVQYAHMEKYSKRRQAKFDGGIVVDFYNTAGQHTSNLVADRGVLYEETNDVEAIGHVIVVSDSGMTMYTERLRWDNARQKIVSNEFVTIVRAEDDTLYGHGFESDQSMKQYSILKPSGVTGKKIDLSSESRPRRSRADSSSIPLDSSAVQKQSAEENQKQNLVNENNR